MKNPTDITQVLTLFVLAGGWALHASRLYRRLDRSCRDPLTGLWTRDGWGRRAERIIARRPRAAVLLADLDGFKPVNDVHGHAAGDAVLAAAGERLTAWCGAHGGPDGSGATSSSRSSTTTPGWTTGSPTSPSYCVSPSSTRAWR